VDDLSRQINYIKSQRPEYTSYKFVSDVASGINFKRKGLSTILDLCLQGLVGEIVVAHKDRLSRFGFDLLELIVSKCGGTIVVLNNQGNKSSEQELSEDLLSIVHIYSCRQMGKRSYRSKCNQSVENKT
jgi:predicted site-specific integrase-resolvase